MDVFSLSSPAGSAAGTAAFLMLRELINELHKTGALTPSDINRLVATAAGNVPSVSNALKNDTRALLESLRR